MCFIRCSWEPLVGSNIKKYVTPQSSGWSKIFFRINEISVRIKGFPRGSKFISLRDTSLWSPDQNMFFSKILVDRWNTLRIENSDGSKSFLSTGWAPQWNSVDDWGRMQVYTELYSTNIFLDNDEIFKVRLDTSIPHPICGSDDKTHRSGWMLHPAGVQFLVRCKAANLWNYVVCLCVVPSVDKSRKFSYASFCSELLTLCVILRLQSISRLTWSSLEKSWWNLSWYALIVYHWCF